MERYLGYIVEHRRRRGDGPLQPVYGISGDAALDERDRSTSLPGYRGMGPVRIGNQAYRQVQHDVYGSAILAATHVFFDQRLARARRRRAVRAPRSARRARRRGATTSPTPGSGSCAARARVHTFSSVMCWAACDRLARIAARLGLADRAHALARARPTASTRFVERALLERASAAASSSTVGGDDARREPAAARRARLPRAPTIRASPPRCARSSASCSAATSSSATSSSDDFGAPENAFLVCTFWYVNALAALGRRDEARDAVRAPARLPQPARPARRAPRSRRPASSGATSCRPTAWSG